MGWGGVGWGGGWGEGVKTGRVCSYQACGDHERLSEPSSFPSAVSSITPSSHNDRSDLSATVVRYLCVHATGNNSCRQVDMVYVHNAILVPSHTSCPFCLSPKTYQHVTVNRYGPAGV